ncbi:MAG: site-specific integrase [Kofleriaceae bacterium]|nr:site-specific integrase [Myxococcales bacterium]MCB9564103.1 site-specific integrase [Kofleriaceae bacterium]MCB9572529.1 site-specific integrase [Kofleriaceae bacterium]
MTKVAGRRVYARGTRLWVRYQDAAGKTQYRSTGLKVGQEREARAMLDEIERQIAAERRPTLAVAPLAVSMSVAEFAAAWIQGRQHVAGVKDEDARLKNHVLPLIGAMPIADVRPRHIRDLVLALRAKDKLPGNGQKKAKREKLAPRTVRHVFATLHRMFKSAIVEELIESNPVVVEKNILPKNVDKDPEWRATAVYSRGELEALISDDRIPLYRRVMYALEGVGGMRHGEAAGLRWQVYHPQVEPLGKLVIARSYAKTTKTQIPREMPVHPVLARLLAEWKLSGWEAKYGRRPRPDDLIVPTEAFGVRGPANSYKELLEDLDMLGFRPRRGHDLRRTFITLAQVDGASRDVLTSVTHGRSATDIMSLYTTWPWPAVCAEVAKLKLSLRPRLASNMVGVVLGDDDDTLVEANPFGEISVPASSRTVPETSGDIYGDSILDLSEILAASAEEQRVTKPLLYP